MKKLTDVYIKVSTRNKEALTEILNMPHLRTGLYIVFNADSVENANIWEILPSHKQRVTLQQLKRLIETIPTREEIKRLKGQVSAYKLNYKKAVEHSLSKEDELEFLREELEKIISERNILKSDLAIKENEIESLKNYLNETKEWFNECNEDLTKLDFYKARAEEMTKQRKYIYKLYEDLHLEFEEYKEELDDELQEWKDHERNLQYLLIDIDAEIKHLYGQEEALKKQCRASLFWCVLLLSSFILALFL